MEEEDTGDKNLRIHSDSEAEEGLENLGKDKAHSSDLKNIVVNKGGMKVRSSTRAKGKPDKLNL